MSLALSYILKVEEDSLSSLVYAGLIPLVSRCSCRSLTNRIYLLYDLTFMGRINILLLSYSYNKNISLFLLLEVTWNLPVRSVVICLLWSMILENTVWCVFPMVSLVDPQVFWLLLLGGLDFIPCFVHLDLGCCH